MGRTPVNSAKFIVSSESVGVPTAEPWMARSPLISCNGVTAIGSGDMPTTMNLPVGAKPSINSGHSFLSWALSPKLPVRRPVFVAASAAVSLRCCRCSTLSAEVSLRARRFSSSTPNSRNLAAKFVRELNSKVPQTADALHRNKTTRRRAAVSQRVKGRDSRTKQRRCFGVAQRVGYYRQCFDGSDHVLLISPVVADSCDFGVAAVKEVSTPAFETRVVTPTIPAHADTLSLLPSGDLGTQFINDACNLVPRNPRVLNSWPETFFHEHVAVANTTGLHLDQHLPCIRLRNLAFDDLRKSAPGLGIYLCAAIHWCDCCEL